MVLILVRYGEMGLKSRSVRNRFEAIFRDNIKEYFLKQKLECIVSSDWGRIFVRADDEDRALDALRHIFGIVSISVVRECSSDLNTVLKTVAEYSIGLLKDGQSFAVRARRSGDHAYTSMHLAEQAGSVIMDANATKTIRVNLTKPDIKIYIEARKSIAYIFSEIIPCSGGMPLGTQGKIVCVYSDDMGKSAAATWLLMKRGCRAHIICGKRDDEWMKKLGKWDLNLHIYEPGVDLWNTAVAVARKIGATALLSPSEPDPRSTVIAKEALLPIFYPLIGLDETDIEAIKGKLSS